MNPHLKSTHSRSAAMLADAFWLKCSSLSLSLPVSFLTKRRIILLLLPPCLLFSPIPHRNPGYTLAASAVGAPRSRRCKFATCRRIAAQPSAVSLPSYRGTLRKAEKEEKEEEEEGEDEERVTELSRSVGCSATMSSLIVPSTSNQRQRCIVAVRLTNRTTRLSTHLRPVLFSLPIDFLLPTTLGRD